ncbi:urease accessory protein UreF [Desulfosarcina ovata]|uniref:Urease accessory protein UreF n=1 Tax=Desulfosarcina ovata subsp. ovata TaxID=2752305 RepID=A0A5K8AG65_9BACT|nr:urease accessory protein UreF [Desulfosarcina ovata]BBO91499.1 urease accessory protein UreF [Desulfosarcina ovata subsp. ovata]
MAADTITMFDGDHRLLRLMHLVSPSLPTGAFAYSQGLEWAVESGWIKNADDLEGWLRDLIAHNLTGVDVPLLDRMRTACQNQDEAALMRWCDLLLAFRETHELRLEEHNRGSAMVRLLEGLAVPLLPSGLVERCQLAGFALAAAHWQIDRVAAATGYLWSWLENQVLTGIKLIPLGQTQGHRILLQMDPAVAAAVEQGLCLDDDAIGASSPAMAMASSGHETQYTRLYRS